MKSTQQLPGLAPLLAAVLLLPLRGFADPASMMGCGNFDTTNSSAFDNQFKALNAADVKIGRIGAYPGDYWNGSSPVIAAAMDALLLKAWKYGVAPEILFTYYASYYNTNGVKFGQYAKWKSIGAAYATRYAPNSAWLVSQGVSNWGVTLYAAFNEPDNAGFNGGGPGLPLTSADPNSVSTKFDGNYHDALKGLADGIHSVSSAIKFIPGGFMAANAYRDYTCAGFSPAIADLLNNGTLDGLMLHTYNDSQYAPLLSANTNEWSAYRQFRAVKQACGITGNPDFYTDEFNYKNPGGTTGDDFTATRLLTCIWCSLGAVKDDGHTSATKLALLWSLFPVEDVYTTCSSMTPYTPRTPAKTYSFVANLTSGMSFTSLDPFGTGEFTMSGDNNKKLWVWIDCTGYSNHTGTSYTVTGIPAGTKSLNLYGWDGFNGPRQKIAYTGQSSVTFSGLTVGETYMVSAVPTTAVYQTESLPVLAQTASDTHRVFTGPQLSGGAATILDAVAAGDYVTYKLPNVVSGTYNLRVGVKSYPSRGIFQASISRADNSNFTNYGSPQDEYVATEAYPELDLGTFTPGSSSDKAIRFLVTGRNAASSGYSISFDYVKLIAQ